MITHFQRVIHRHGRWIFLILLGFVLVAFLLWDFAGTMGSSALAEGGSVYGRKIGPRELDLAKRRSFLNLQLMTGQDVQANERASALMQSQTLRRMALLEKARRMGIAAADGEVVEEARQVFVDKEGKYDAAAYARFVNDALLPRRLTEADFEILMRENIILRKLMAVIASTVKVTPQQVAEFAGELSEKLAVSAFRFELNDFMGQVKPAEADLARFYERTPDRFRVPEKVKVAYVVFPIQPSKVTITDLEIQEAYEANRNIFTTPEGKVKPLKEVIDVLRFDIVRRKAQQGAMKPATEFTVQMVGEEGKPPPSFQEMAKSNKLEVKQTPFFSSRELVDGIAAPEFSEAAFRITADNPTSDPVVAKDAVYVLQFVAKQESFLPPFEQVKDAVRNAHIAEAALKLAREAGEKKRTEFIALLDQGRSLDQAAASLKLKSQVFQGFSAAESLPKDPYESLVRRVSFQIPAGSVSDFIPNSAGGFFVYVASRQGGKAEEIAKLEPQVRQALIQMQQQQLVQDFQQTVMQEAGVQPPRLDLSEENSMN